jgi:aspartyl protease family protein
VDALVHDGNALPVVLLGMSFLNRVEMRRDGPTMTLIKRF